MLIVCTQDQAIRQAAMDVEKGGPAWEPVVLLPLGAQAEAQARFAASLRRLAVNEALCLSAHGNDTELGDAQDGWTWTAADVAALLADNVVEGWMGPILVHACAETVASFSAGLAVALDRLCRFNGLWCYGFNRPVPDDDGFPPPVDLGRRVDLQGTQVRC